MPEALLPFLDYFLSVEGLKALSLKDQILMYVFSVLYVFGFLCWLYRNRVESPISEWGKIEWSGSILFSIFSPVGFVFCSAVLLHMIWPALTKER